MNIIDLIDTFNFFIKKQRELKKIPTDSGFIVAHKTIEDTPNFTAYKKYRVRLYINAKESFLEICKTFNSSQINEVDAWNLIAKDLSFELFTLISTSAIDRLINGTYTNEK